MTFEGIIGHERPLALLRAALAGGRVPHAWLFSGPDGVGKERIAVAFAQALLCAEPDRPCGRCDACRKIGKGMHPDVLLLLPEAERVARKLLARDALDKAPSRELRIADIREMEHRVRLPANAGGQKVVLIAPADRMNPPAQNALLKTLEEPPPDTTLILVTAAEGGLLPTVRSRCVRVPFAPLPVDQVAEVVARERGCDAGTARVLATIAGGSLGRALALDPETVAERQEVVERLRAFDPDDGAALTGLAEGLAADRDAAEKHLDILALWYRDVLALQSGAGEDRLANADLLEAARDDAGRLSPHEVLERLRGVDEAREHLLFNVNPRLVYEGLLSTWRTDR